ncbi:MAG: hypothetical protein AMXMBFR16_10480 [Candidatus Uhrbacteria bacterium]
MKITEALIAFLKNSQHNTRRVADWYSPNMEVQIMVSKDDGELVDGKMGTFTNGEETWYNVRIPRNANEIPVNNDHELQYNPKHFEAIGMTGWDWVNKRSVRVGFDFDAITGHAQGVGISAEALLEIQTRLSTVEEALLLKSTGGNGLHLYLEFNPENLPETNNHTEHAALALACLRILSQQVEFDFQAGMDVGGGNMWVWHRKMNPDNNGLTILKPNTSYFEPPPNWRDYIDVATRKRSKVKLIGVPDEDQQTVSDRAAAEETIKLEEDHLRIIDDLQQMFPNFTTMWLADHNLLQTHTQALKLYYAKRQEIGDPLKGAFDTLSEGRDPSKPNCFCFPLPGGGFRVCRFGKGAKEHKCWRSDESGWTSITYNETFNLDNAAVFAQGHQVTKGEGYYFDTTANAVNAIAAMGGELTIPSGYEDREVNVRPHKDKDKLIVEIIKRPKEGNIKLEGWQSTKGVWSRIISVDAASGRSSTVVDLEILDKAVRYLKTPTNVDAGWACNLGGGWVNHNAQNARIALRSNYDKMTEHVLSDIFNNPWVLVNLPFQPEYPGGRKWNRDAAQLKYSPSGVDDPVHPHWDLVLSHIGGDLDKVLKDNEWAKKNNIQTGREYMLLYIASLFREPFQPLPYLFLWGPQESGKSTLHEILSEIMTKGVARADTAITSQSDFNGELASAILCVIEEKDISAVSASAYNKIKDWVTGLTISIHPKHRQPYDVPNTTHWMQVANSKSHCPVFPGDTRITVLYVPKPPVEIPKAKLMDSLLAETPDFLTTLMRVQIPTSDSRLRIPALMTASKSQMEETNKTALETFVEDYCYVTPGHMVDFNEFCLRFRSSLTDQAERDYWTTKQIVTSLPMYLPYGKYNSKRVIGNLSFDPDTPPQQALTFEDGKLVFTVSPDGEST